MKILCVDPGEDTGWAVFEDGELIDSGTEKLWEFGSAVFRALVTGEVFLDDDLAHQFIGVEEIVVEDFRIYPWEAKKGSLNWDQVRTARLIGALTLIAHEMSLKFTLQPAKIKERAEAAGAEALFSKPLHENRHANDAIRHGVYYYALLRGARPIEEAEIYVTDGSEA